MKFLYFLIPAFIFQACKAQETPLPGNKDENTLLWEISGNGLNKPSYLFGTFHLMCKDDIRFGKSVTDAITASKEVYFEMDLDDVSTMLGGLLLMNMKDQKTLKDLYTEEEYAKVETYFRDTLKTPIALVQRMKPLFLQAMLYPKLMPCKSMSGVEQELMAIAKKEKKDIKGLETMAFQASVFDSIPYDVQAKDLLKSIDSIHTYEGEFGKMLDMYKSQRLDNIETMFTTSEFGMMESQEILLDNRNRNWVEQLKAIMPKDNVFVAVGAGHLPGKMGLITLLRQAGYTLRPLAN